MKKWLKANKKYVFLFLFGIIIHWLILFLVFTILSKVNGIEENFWQFFYNRYIDCGDTPHYLYIAKNWYPTAGDIINKIVFFPLYPLLIKIFSFIIHDYFISGVIISNICAGLSVSLLYYYAELEFKDQNKAIESVYAYILYPFSFFLLIVFTESLFIMLSLLCLIFIKKKKWLLVGIFGMLCALTRMQGIVLIVPAIYQIIINSKQEKKFNWHYLYVLLIGLGFGLYLILNRVVTGDFFGFVYYQKIAPWYNSAQWISSNLAQHYDQALNYPGLSYIIYWVQLILFFLIIFLLFLGIKRNVSRYLVLYGACFLVVTYFQGWMISGPRHVMSCVPMYLIIPSIKNEYLKNVLFILLGILTVMYTFYTLAGHAIM